MAVDELLLESMPELRQPVFRVYSWTEPAATFGYFQHYRQVEQLTPLRPMIRRPTGGGIVPHDADWTYSIAIPVGHEWHRLRATESYSTMHRWIQASFARLGINSELAPISFKPKPGQCFVGHEQCDLLWQGRKIAGAAQRRRKEGLLIQGSIQPPPAADRRSWERAMLEVLSCEHQTKWRPFEWTAQLEERAATLARSKYSQPAYNEGR